MALGPGVHEEDLAEPVVGQAGLHAPRLGVGQCQAECVLRVDQPMAGEVDDQGVGGFGGARLTSLTMVWAAAGLSRTVTCRGGRRRDSGPVRCAARACMRIYRPSQLTFSTGTALGPCTRAGLVRAVALSELTVLLLSSRSRGEHTPTTFAM
ncbi:hypothetical protein AMK20_13540 [Streptomyces sp. TSRI0261]|nr:hypothetical protein AMK20_13540 [Streptomyces sp. TSRI0261]